MVESPLQAGDAQKGLRTSRGLLSEWLQSLDGTLVVPIAKLKPLGGFEYIGERSGGRRVWLLDQPEAAVCSVRAG